ncbi:MAG TPA: response regulator [Tepidisphaeraceae bacterium]|jgi:DNA-binding response OmpR family regulator|nr:response regulator [Tepidisphaeraceae bacterium]
MTENRSVLVVEDDPEINELVGAYCQIAGFDYQHASTGASALEQAHATPPTLIVLDLMLPDTDGFEVCRQLKHDPQTRHIPVLMLTALEGDEERQKAQSCGISAYLTKPFNPDHLMHALQHHAR